MARKHFMIKQLDARTLRWWWSKATKIDMQPPYQRRGRLWSRTDKAYLIDSILNGFDVPKLYMADFTWSDSALNTRRAQYAIIDGKQRLEAIFDFFEGAITLDGDFRYLPDPTLDLAGLSYRDLKKNHAEIADDFDNYNLMVMGVVAESEGPINELFVRLNRSKPLTGAETRNAMAGPAPEVIRQIARHEFFSEIVKFATNRGADLNASAKILLFEYYGKLSETKKKTLDAFVRDSEKAASERLELAGRKTLEVLDDLAEIFLPRDVLLSSAGIVPVYYWLVRNCPESAYAQIREGLVAFERERRENRQLVKERPDSDKIDEVLLEYDQLNRSTNDIGSHRRRWEILAQRLGVKKLVNSKPSARKRKKVRKKA